MKKLRVFANVVVTGQSFVGVPRTVVPNQSLSLKDILQRFVRREALPVMKEGFYEDRFGDLEKMKTEDITQKVERVEELKKFVAKGKKLEEDRAVKEKADAQAKFDKSVSEAVQAAQKPPGPANSPPVEKTG